MKRLAGLFLIFIIPHTFYAQGLLLLNCEEMEYEINDHTDIDGDGNICESHITISNSASYSNDNCGDSEIFWEVLLDLNKDGSIDIEYLSSLPESDISLDDTNNNGIPDLYISPTINNQVRDIQIMDLEGPFSEHNVSWIAYDNCDFTASCEADFSLSDKKSPTPFCLSIANFVLIEPELEIVASDFNLAGFDNCTHYQDLITAFDSLGMNTTRLLTCEDVVASPFFIDIYVIDESGNFDFCKVYISVFPSNVVDCFDDKRISGKVTNYKEEPISDARVTLSANLPEFPRQAITDENGEYDFGVQIDGIAYTLSVKKDEPFTEGISTFDLVIMMRHILGLQPLESPYLHFAADVNLDNKIRVSDLTQLRKLILGIIVEFSGNLPWRFFDQSHEFEDPLDPMTDPAPSIIEFDKIEDVSYDFIGVKVGNVKL